MACAGPRVAFDPAQPENSKGKLLVSYLYLPPAGEIEPSYHTVIWLADQNGKWVRTLFVSQELSTTVYDLNEACKERVKQANWDKADKSVVDALTGPTRDIGSSALEFPVESLGFPLEFISCGLRSISPRDST
jgi:hypothetical protein